MKRSMAGWALLPIVAVVVVALDQWTKGWVETHLALGDSFAPFPALEPYFKVVHYTNTGAAFGILRGQGSLFVMVALVVIVAVLVYSRYLPSGSWTVRLCFGLQLGGAVGNLVDRIQWGHVTDFLSFTLPIRGRVLEWPAFNVADSSIVVGVILLAFLLMRGDDTEGAVGPAASEMSREGPAQDASSDATATEKASAAADRS